MSDNKTSVIVCNKDSGIVLDNNEVKILEYTLYNCIHELFDYEFKMEKENSEELLNEDNDYIKLKECIGVLRKILNQMGNDL